MRTTIRVDDELLREAKLYAVETGRTLTAVIEDAFRQAIARRSRADRDYARFPGLRWRHPLAA